MNDKDSKLIFENYQQILNEDPVGLGSAAKEDDIASLFDKGELTVVEEFIPKKDDAGNWIDFEYPPRSKFKIVDLDSDFLPKEINYHYILESILARIKERIDFNKEYVFYEDDIKELEEYLGGILDKIKNEIVT